MPYQKSYDFKVGDQVSLRREPDRRGTIKVVEDNQLSVMVQWDYLKDDPAYDFQWINKLEYWNK